MVLPDLGGWSYTGYFASRLADTDISWESAEATAVHASDQALMPVAD